MIGIEHTLKFEPFSNIHLLKKHLQFLGFSVLRFITQPETKFYFRRVFTRPEKVLVWIKKLISSFPLIAIIPRQCLPIDLIVSKLHF